MHFPVSRARAGRVTLAALLVFSLAACGGGGGRALPAPAPSATAAAAGNAVKPTSSARLKLSFHRSTPPTANASARRKGALALRAPHYVSGSTNGMVIVATSTYGSVTSYYSLSETSSNCTTSGTQNSIVSCTVTVPFAGFHQTLVATLWDQTPTTDAGGNPNGFDMTANILGVGTGTYDFTQGTANAIAMTIGPVAGQMDDDFASNVTLGQFDDNADYTLAPNLPPFDGFAPYGPAGAQQSRVVVGVGTPTDARLSFGIFDRTGNYAVGAPIAATPFVDVNGTATPLTVASDNAGVTVFAMPNPGTSTPTYSSSSAIPDLSYQWDNGGANADVYLKYDGSAFSFAHVVVGNSLTATPPEPGYIENPVSSGETAGATYAATLTYLVTPVSTTTATLTMAAGGPTMNVTASDYHAVNGLLAGSIGANGIDGECQDDAGSQYASISSTSIDTGTWKQIFTVHPMVAGTCFFLIVDSDSAAAGQPVFARPITVTINPS